MTPKMVKVFSETHFRAGGSTRGRPDNLITTTLVPAEEFEAIAQAACQEVVDPAIGRNFWWVLLSWPGHGVGWVTALHVATGGNDEPIPGVDRWTTEFNVPDYTPAQIDAAPTVEVFRPTAFLLGGSTNPDPDNRIGEDGHFITIDPGRYPALEQCAGQDFARGSDRNFWWVYIWLSGWGGGWVSAVDITTGGNDEPIPGVVTRMTSMRGFQQ